MSLRWSISLDLYTCPGQIFELWWLSMRRTPRTVAVDFGHGYINKNGGPCYHDPRSPLEQITWCDHFICAVNQSGLTRHIMRLGCKWFWWIIAVSSLTIWVIGTCSFRAKCDLETLNSWYVMKMLPEHCPASPSKITAHSGSIQCTSMMKGYSATDGLVLRGFLVRISNV